MVEGALVAGAAATTVIDQVARIVTASERSQFRNWRVPTLAPAGRFRIAEKNALRRQTLVAESSCAFLCANDEPRGRSFGTAVIGGKEKVGINFPVSVRTGPYREGKSS